MKRLTPEEIDDFRRIVYRHYAREGRNDLPWRNTTDPYRILVSEIMLQQTHVRRVLEAYEPFLERFPDIESLAEASLRSVLEAWSGLGYNRRALALKACAEQVTSSRDGLIPREYEELLELRGVGPATAGAVSAFAFGSAYPFLETNIRAVFIHHFFPGREGVPDSELMPIAEQTLDRDDPRRWYYALMDYGVSLKKLYGNPSRRSAHHVTQAPFRGSDREARGLILRALTSREMEEDSLAEATGLALERLRRNLTKLEREGFVVKERGAYRIGD
jgi:A/G-specific adenine glycosylase